MVDLAALLAPCSYRATYVEWGEGWACVGSAKSTMQAQPPIIDFKVSTRAWRASLDQKMESQPPAATRVPLIK